MTDDELSRIPHLEYVYSPTMARFKNQLYRVDKHFGKNRIEECRQIGGRCAFELTKPPL